MKTFIFHYKSRGNTFKFRAEDCNDMEHAKQYFRECFPHLDWFMITEEQE